MEAVSVSIYAGSANQSAEESGVANTVNDFNSCQVLQYFGTYAKSISWYLRKSAWLKQEINKI